MRGVQVLNDLYGCCLAILSYLHPFGVESRIRGSRDPTLLSGSPSFGVLMPVMSSDLPEPNRPLSEVKADLFKALAHPARVRALEVLAEGERSVSDLQPLVGIETSH